MPRLTVASWDVNQRAACWSQLETLRSEHGVQVALVQEAVPGGEGHAFAFIEPPFSARERWRIAVPPRVQRRNYASAIAILDETLRFEPLPPTNLSDAGWEDLAGSHPGQFAVGKLSVPGSPTEILLVSLYGVWHQPSGNGAEATLHRAISDLTPLLLSNARVILAGDLNLFRNTNNKGQPRFNTVFERLTAYGLELRGPFRSKGDPAQVGCTCRQGDNCDHVETFRIWRRNAVPYQDDYVFSTESLPASSCRALIHEVTDYADRSQRHSDHWPIVTVFEV